MQLVLSCMAFSTRFVAGNDPLENFKLIALRMSITLEMEVYTQN